MAPSHDRLASARTYIAIAESEDSKREAYTQAADEIIAWLAEDPKRTQRQAGEGIGKGTTFVAKLVRWRTNESDHLPFGGSDQMRDVHNYATRKTLRERPEVVIEALDSLSNEQLDALAEKVVESPLMSMRVETALKRERAKPIPMGDSTPREPLHWMLLKLTSIGLSHDRFIEEDGDRCINLGLDLRTAASVILDTNIAKLAKFREALLAEDLDERAELLAQALKMDALKKKDPDAEFSEILGGAS